MPGRDRCDGDFGIRIFRLESRQCVPKVVTRCKRLQAVCRAAGVEDVVLAPMQLVEVARLRTQRAPQVDHEYEGAAVVGLIEDNVDRGVGYATTVPEQL